MYKRKNFWIKNRHIGLLKPPQRTLRLFKHEIFWFSFFVDNFYLPGFGSGFPIRIRWPNWIRIQKNSKNYKQWDLFNGLDALVQPVREAECAGEAAHAQQEVLQHLLPLHRQVHLGKHKKCQLFLPFSSALRIRNHPDEDPDSDFYLIQIRILIFTLK